MRVTQDDDGGVTIHCPQTGVVISLIETHPAMIGPANLLMEAYPYATDREMRWGEGVEFGRHLRMNLWTKEVDPDA